VHTGVCAITVHTTSQMQQVHIGMLDEVMANWNAWWSDG